MLSISRECALAHVSPLLVASLGPVDPSHPGLSATSRADCSPSRMAVDACL